METAWCDKLLLAFEEDILDCEDIEERLLRIKNEVVGEEKKISNAKNKLRSLRKP